MVSTYAKLEQYWVRKYIHNVVYGDGVGSMEGGWWQCCSESPADCMQGETNEYCSAAVWTNQRRAQLSRDRLSTNERAAVAV